MPSFIAAGIIGEYNIYVVGTIARPPLLFQGERSVSSPSLRSVTTILQLEFVCDLYFRIGEGKKGGRENVEIRRNVFV